jgi:RNA polymerase sigma-70 factor, ECF subfamily
LAKEISNIIEFTLIYNRYKSKLFNYVWKMVNNTIITEDIIQTVFLKFFENMNNLKNKDSFEFWIFKTARNEVYNYYRSKKLKESVYEQVDIDSLSGTEKDGIEYVLDQKEMKKMIMKELDNSPLAQKEIYLLKEYGQLSYKEISELMGIEEELVKSRLYKIRRKLVNKISKILFYGV